MNEKRPKIIKVIYYLVLLSFIIPIIYLIYKIIVTKDGAFSDTRSWTDYVLMLLECVLGILVIHIPSFLSRKLKFEIPNSLYLMYIIFLYCAIFLGEVRSFYYLVPNFDVVLHAFSSLMSGAFGFMVVHILNKDEHTSINLSPRFVALFAFCFSVAIGALWEIYEFTFDGLLGLNMQKYKLADGTLLTGHAALTDTMKDIIVDTLGAMAASIYGYHMLIRKKKK